MKRPILLDCDPGNDDALGILVACGSPNLALTAVTTGAGHLSHDRTARNAAITLAAAKANHIPVTRGAEGPLVRERLIAQALDMERGLDRERKDLAATTIEPKTTSAEMIANVAMAGEPLTIVTTGPLTNLALALRNCPAMAPQASAHRHALRCLGTRQQDGRGGMERPLRSRGGGDRLRLRRAGDVCAH